MFLGSDYPKVVLGYDNYTVNITTIQCVLTVGELDYLYLERLSLLKDGVLLNSIEVPKKSGVAPILKLDAEEIHNASYACLLEMGLTGAQYYPKNISATSMTRVRGNEEPRSTSTSKSS